MNTTEAPVAPRLPVFEVIARSYRYVWDQRRNFAVAWAMIIAALTISALTRPLLIDPQYNWVPGVFNILAGIIATAFHVGVFRQILLRNSTYDLGVLIWGRDWLRYLLVSCGFALICFVSFVAPLLLLGYLFSAVPQLGMAAGAFSVPPAIACVFFIGHRLILALPAAAIGARRPFALSWRSSEENIFRLFAVCFLAFLPSFISLVLITVRLVVSATAAQASDAVASWQETLTGGASLPIVLAITGTWAGTVLTTSLGLSYERLDRREAASDAPFEA